MREPSPAGTARFRERANSAKKKSSTSADFIGEFMFTSHALGTGKRHFEKNLATLVPSLKGLNSFLTLPSTDVLG
jgi:hypothetical protein